MSVNIPPRIYLDQNAWINLARAFYGKDKSGKYDVPLEALVRAADLDQVRVPLSFNHLIEVCAAGDMERRRRLARFMITVSKQYAIAPFMRVRHEEAFTAVMRRFGIDENVLNPEKLVQQGLWCALGIVPTLEGGTSEQRELLENALRSDETAVKMLSEWMDSAAGRTLRDQSEHEAAHSAKGLPLFH